MSRSAWMPMVNSPPAKTMVEGTVRSIVFHP